MTTPKGRSVADWVPLPQSSPRVAYEQPKNIPRRLPKPTLLATGAAAQILAAALFGKAELQGVAHAPSFI
ncbi:MAG: hypothetical protein NT089_06445 [Planctomycetia bacterium]|nr:hypothetical protein [Planctomycetia bacterium]